MHVLLHHDGVGARGQRRAGEDALRRAGRKFSRRVAAARLAGERQAKDMRCQIDDAHGITVHGRVVERRMIGARVELDRDIAPKRLHKRHGLGAGTAPHGGKNGRLGLF